MKNSENFSDDIIAEELDREFSKADEVSENIEFNSDLLDEQKLDILEEKSKVVIVKEQDKVIEQSIEQSVEQSSSVETKEKIEWFVIHTYSGYENKVKASIEKIIENRNMQDVITDVVVPMQDVVEFTKSGQEKVVARKIFPGYVFLKMAMNDETWYVVRNTRGVTSFVGPGSKPVPLTEDEVLNMGIESFLDSYDIALGDVVLIKDGPFAKSSGVIKEINMNKRTIIVSVNFFGRETPVELDFHQVQQMD